jgi:ADP-ribose pyrophosphatase YjhB (NUDIX family)
MIRRWYEYDPMKDKIKVSAGIVLILNGSKILLVHPSKAKWFGTYSVPKGGVNPGESDIDAALRELREETSLLISKDMISNPNDPIIIDYADKQGKKYKKLVLFKVYITNTSEVSMNSETIEKKRLQLKEVDWSGFLDKNEAQSKIFHRMFELLDLI